MKTRSGGRPSWFAHHLLPALRVLVAAPDGHFAMAIAEENLVQVADHHWNIYDGETLVLEVSSRPGPLRDAATSTRAAGLDVRAVD